MRTGRALVCSLLLMMLAPVLRSAAVTLSQQIISGAAQVGDAGTVHLSGSLGGLVMGQGSGGTVLLISPAITLYTRSNGRVIIVCAS